MQQELTDEGVDLSEDETRTVGREARAAVGEILVDELLYARQPPVHEGRRPPYGSLVFATQPSSEEQDKYFKRIDFAEDSGSEARRPLSNGLSTFTVRTLDGPEFLAIFKSTTDELFLVRMAQALNCWVVQRHPNGAVRVFARQYLYLFENDEWSRKRYANLYLAELENRTAYEASFELVAARIMDFCSHLLSARHIGATFVWMLKGSSATIEERLKPPPTPTAAQLNITNADHTELIAALLASLDGACVLEQDGAIAGVGAMLQADEKAKKHISLEAGKGTRHISAARFSFDVPEVVAFVVSADGPVSVFSDGVKTLDITPATSVSDYFDAIAQQEVEQYMHGKEDVECPTCEKLLLVEYTEWFGENSIQTASCPACGDPQAVSRNCISLIRRVMKPWEVGSPGRRVLFAD